MYWSVNIGMISLNNEWLALGSTSISNTFILDFLPVAKGDYIKVYLYGLMYAYNSNNEISLSMFAKELGMVEEEVLQAFQYWERRKLVVRLQDNPVKYEYIPVSVAAANRIAENYDEAYIRFSDSLYSQFGERRKLHGNETKTAFEWIEELNIPQEVIMMLIQHMIANHGVNFNFNKAQKEAIKLKENKILNVELAETYFSRSASSLKGAKQILRRFGKYRNPTEDELQLYLKWTQTWNLNQDAIIAACKETTKGDASFAYLDAILNSILKRGKNIQTEQDVLNYLENAEKESELIREILRELGMSSAKRNVTKGVKELYKELSSKSSHELIKYAASIVGAKGGKLDALAEQLNFWNSKEINTVDQAKDYISDINSADKTLKKIYDTLGVNMVPNSKDRKQIETWVQKYNFNNDMLIKCAEFAKGKNSPFAYMQRIFERWFEIGIKTPKQVDEAFEFYKNTKSKSKTKIVNEQKYSQRTYDDNDYNIWKPDFDNEVETNE